MTWLGHSTTLLELGQVKLLTDPVMAGVGASMALPVLESVVFEGPRARADIDRPVYSVFFRTGNGVQQAARLLENEPERFWPREPGSISRASLLGGDSDRAVSELADWADRLLMVRGTRYAFPQTNCAHAGGMCQALTASSFTSQANRSLANGPSIDWLIAQRCNPPGVEPLTLMTGSQNQFIGHRLSFSGPQQLRGAENNPFLVYTDLFGVDRRDEETIDQLAQRRKSVNDLVREELRDLLGNPQLGSYDRRNLNQHLEAIRDVEVQLSCTLMDGRADAIRTIGEAATDNDLALDVTRIFMDLIAISFACDLTRTATLQHGGGTDGYRYVVDGERRNSFHRISHRVDSDGDLGAPRVANADLLHHGVDRLMLQAFSHLLGRLQMYPGRSNPDLLSNCMAVWINDIGTGYHSYDNLPWIIGGSADGFLKQGAFVDVNGAGHNRLLNTVLSAHGLRNADGDLYDSFGDGRYEPGVLDQLIA